MAIKLLGDILPFCLPLTVEFTNEGKVEIVYTCPVLVLPNPEYP